MRIPEGRIGPSSRTYEVAVPGESPVASSWELPFQDLEIRSETVTGHCRLEADWEDTWEH